MTQTGQVQQLLRMYHTMCGYISYTMQLYHYHRNLLMCLYRQCIFWIPYFSTKFFTFEIRCDGV